MIKIWNKEKGMILCLAGVYVEDSKNCFEARLEIIGIIATSGERISLGLHERERAKVILESIAKSMRSEDAIYILRE